MTTNDTKQLESHFAFGENWLSFVDSVTEDNITEAKNGLTRLLPANEISGCRLIDIGCGSGLSMLAALRIGARSVLGIDIDPKSAEAARALLSRHLPNGQWTARAASVFDLSPDKDGTFDIVYSWGVLHATGDMRMAIRKAAALVRPGGHLAIAVYRKTPLCGFWRREKQLYSTSNRAVQTIIRLAYQTVYGAGLLATGRNPIRYVRNYKSRRGMSWYHDVHDWLGGYPHESAEPEDVVRLLHELGFAMRFVFEKPAVLGGLLGSHCDEFVAVRQR